MKYLIVLLVSLSVMADCNIFVETESVEYIGYNLNISQANYNLLTDKKFERVFDNSNSYSLKVDAYEVVGERFNKAESKMIIMKGDKVHYELVVNKTCFTQSCSVGDVANSLNKLFVKARKKLSSCI